MESINAVVIVAGLTMVIGIILFIKGYNNKNKDYDTLDSDMSESVEHPVIYPGIPGIIPGTPVVVTEYDDDDNLLDYDDNEIAEEVVEIPAEEVIVKAPLMITINSIDRIKTKSREFLMDSANLTKKEADAILDNLEVPFDATDMDLRNAPFKYTVVD